LYQSNDVENVTTTREQKVSYFSKEKRFYASEELTNFIVFPVNNKLLTYQLVNFLEILFMAVTQLSQQSSSAKAKANQQAIVA